MSSNADNLMGKQSPFEDHVCSNWLARSNIQIKHASLHHIHCPTLSWGRHCGPFRHTGRNPAPACRTLRFEPRLIPDVRPLVIHCSEPTSVHRRCPLGGTTAARSRSWALPPPRSMRASFGRWPAGAARGSGLAVAGRSAPASTCPLRGRQVTTRESSQLGAAGG